MRTTTLLGCLLLALVAAPAPSAAAQAAAKAPAAKAAGTERDGPQAAAPTEKSLLADFAKEFSPSDPAARAAAITHLGDASRSLPDGGSSRLVARTLAKGLLDEELEVRAAAVGQLSWGRHVDSAIEDLGASLTDLLAQIDRRLTRPDPESRQYVARGSRIFGDGAAALANYRDDRSVDALVTLLRGLQRNTTGGNNLSTHVVGPLADAVLSLGTHDAVEAAVKQTQTYVGVDGRQEAAELLLHRSLAAFAVKLEQAPPEYSENVSVEWNKWFEKFGDKLPKSLGKLKTPPASPPPEMKKGMRDRKDDGSAPRQ